MKKRFLSMLFPAVALSAGVSAQYNIPENKIWAFGQNAGLNFSGAPPTIFHTGMNAFEGCASIAKKELGILFYTNGNDIWNAQGNLMPNGSNITGTLNSTYSTTQGALIVPAPNNENRFYVFSLWSLPPWQLACNVVDVTLDNGLGDVDLNYPLRNVPLRDSLSEKMIAIAGCNNNVWVVVHDNQNHFLSYEVTAAGVNTTPVISTIPNDLGFSSGTMRLSPDGNKIAAAKPSNTELATYNFDISTGLVSDKRVLDATSVGNYSCAYSPDGTKLYTSNGANIVQYNLNDINPSQSKIVLGHNLPLDMRLGYDGKVYFISGIGSLGEYLGCIHHPNVLGAGCGYDSTAVHYPGADHIVVGFPNEVVVARSNVQPADINRVMLDSVVCNFSVADSVKLNTVAGFNNYLWSNGSSSLSTTVYQPGTYFVTYNTICGTRTDTFKIRMNVSDLSIVNNNGILSTNNIYNSYQWYRNGSALQGMTQPTLTTSANGLYAVAVRNMYGCTDSITYVLNVDSGGNGTAIQNPATLTSSVLIYPNPATDMLYIKSPVAFSASFISVEGRQLFISKEKSISLKTLAPGLYFINIKDEKGTLIKVEELVKRQ